MLIFFESKKIVLFSLCLMTFSTEGLCKKQKRPIARSNLTVAEDLALCEIEVTKKVLAVEVAGEPKYSKVGFVLDQAKVEDSEMPDMTGDSRRRRRSKRSPKEKIPPPQIGRKIQFEGEVIDKLKKQKVQARCLVYKGRVVTATFELDNISMTPMAPTE